MVSFRGQKRLGHGQIGLLYGFNSKFPTSLPTPFICEVSPPPTPGVSPWNDFWGTSGEIPRWPCVTTWEHWKLKRSVSAPKWQFSPAGQVPMSDSAPSGAIWAQFRPKQLNQKGSPAHTGAHFSSWVGLYYTHRNGPILTIWVVRLIGWSKFSTNQKHYPVSSVWNFPARSSEVNFRGNQWWLLSLRLGSSGEGTNRSTRGKNLSEHRRESKAN